MKLLGVLVLPGLIVLALAYAETRLVSDSSPGTQAHAKGIVWAGHTFVDRAEFARWLRSHGIRYRVWARRHPALVAPPRLRQARRAVRHAPRVAPAQRRSGWALARTAGAIAALAALGLALLLAARRFVRWARCSLPTLRGRLAAYRPPDPVTAQLAPAVPAAPAAARPTPARTARVRPAWSAAEAWTAGGRRAGGALVAAGPTLVSHVRDGLDRAQLGARAAARGPERVRSGLRAAALWLSVWSRLALALAQRRKTEVAWCLATALLAAGTGLLVSVWLGGA